MGDVCSVEPHPLQRSAAEQRRPLRHGGRRVHAAIDGLRQQSDQLHLRRLRAGPLPQALDMPVQLIPLRLQPPDQRRQCEVAVKISEDVAEGQSQVLQDADGPELDEGINGIVAVSRGAVLDIRPDQPEFLVVEDGAACDVQRPRDFADRKQISFFFHKIPLKTQKNSCIAR